jgi:hypothetical protein
MQPPGEYTVEVADMSGVIVLRGSAGNSVALLTTFSDAVPHTTAAQLIFERRDGMAYLSAVGWQGTNVRVMSAFKQVAKAAVAAALR